MELVNNITYHRQLSRTGNFNTKYNNGLQLCTEPGKIDGWTVCIKIHLVQILMVPKGSIQLLCNDGEFQDVGAFHFAHYSMMIYVRNFRWFKNVSNDFIVDLHYISRLFLNWFLKTNSWWVTSIETCKQDALLSAHHFNPQLFRGATSQWRPRQISRLARTHGSHDIMFKYSCLLMHMNIIYLVYTDILEFMILYSNMHVHQWINDFSLHLYSRSHDNEFKYGFNSYEVPYTRT